MIDDALLVMGSVLKELMENERIDVDLWDACSVLLGSGCLLVWFGVLRYLGFFRTYNMLIVTLKKALPSVLRFLLCALLIYAGFTLCGWLIFAPYHFKASFFPLNQFVFIFFFKDLSSSSTSNRTVDNLFDVT